MSYVTRVIVPRAGVVGGYACDEGWGVEREGEGVVGAVNVTMSRRRGGGGIRKVVCGGGFVGGRYDEVRGGCVVNNIRQMRSGDER